MLAKDWVLSDAEFPKGFYCQNSAIFLARIIKMETMMMQDKDTKEMLPLLTSVAGEIGNNSYDHNIGKWIDAPGIFFGYDLNKKQIVLADRGVGILETLILIFLGLFIIGLILSLTIWLMWLFLILAIILFIARLVQKVLKKITLK